MVYTIVHSVVFFKCRFCGIKYTHFHDSFSILGFLLSNIGEVCLTVITGGQVTNNTGQCLLNGVLHASRGLGYHGDPSLRKQVLVGPYTASVAFDEYAQFVVMATSGVWEVFSDEDVVNLLTKVRKE